MMKDIITEKDSKIEKQSTEMTNLRKKNFEFRSKIQELQDEARASRSNPSGQRNQGGNERRSQANDIQDQ